MQFLINLKNGIYSFSNTEPESVKLWTMPKHEYKVTMILTAFTTVGVFQNPHFLKYIIYSEYSELGAIHIIVKSLHYIQGAQLDRFNILSCCSSSRVPTFLSLISDTLQG